MTFSIRPISGTANYIIRQRADESSLVSLVAEVVEFPDGYTLYRMDATGQLATGLATPESALAFYEQWVNETHPNIEGILEG